GVPHAHEETPGGGHGRVALRAGRHRATADRSRSEAHEKKSPKPTASGPLAPTFSRHGDKPNGAARDLASGMESGHPAIASAGASQHRVSRRVPTIDSVVHFTLCSREPGSAPCHSIRSTSFARFLSSAASVSPSWKHSQRPCGKNPIRGEPSFSPR